MYIYQDSILFIGVKNMLENVMVSVIAAVIYAGSAYLKRSFDPKNPEAFDGTKFLATLVVSVFVGVSLSVMGLNITSESIELQLAMYAGTIMVVENVLKSTVRYLRARGIGV